MGKAARQRRRQLELEVPRALSRTIVLRDGDADSGWRREVVLLEERCRKDRARQLELVRQALLAGVGYAEVARVLGVTRQAVQKRFRNEELGVTE